MEGLTKIIVDKNLTIFILHILNTSKPLLLNYSKTRIQTTKDSGCFARFCFTKASVTNEGCLRGKHLFSNSNKPGGGIQGREGCPGNGLCGCRISYLCGQQREFTSEKSTKTQPRLVASQLNSQYRYLVMRVENHIKKPETFKKFPAYKVPKAGLEPAQDCSRTPLKRVRLPIPPLRCNSGSAKIWKTDKRKNHRKKNITLLQGHNHPSG